jgi:DNA-binding transcriptional ArsR family regulator
MTMGATKTDHFTDKQNELAVLAKALGHPARLAIVEYLLKQKECVCGDIVSELPLAQATVSQHLKELKSAGIIKGNIEGNSICYCLNEETIAEFISFLSNITSTISNQRNQCC